MLNKNAHAKKGLGVGNALACGVCTSMWRAHWHVACALACDVCTSMQACALACGVCTSMWRVH